MSRLRGYPGKLRQVFFFGLSFADAPRLAGWIAPPSAGILACGYTDIRHPTLNSHHRDHEYPEDHLELLRQMQESHFWYQGRHRFLLESFDRFLPFPQEKVRLVDLGGGCGGWLRYIFDRGRGPFARAVLADSSPRALEFAAGVLPPAIEKIRIDLMDLQLEGGWNVAFLLDVIEHLPEDTKVLRQAARILAPKGFLFLTVPAFPLFWSVNDELACHLRRYRRKNLVRLAREADLVLLDSRYFMFFLSPLYLLSRLWLGRRAVSARAREQAFRSMHQTPPSWLNHLLALVFSWESPLGHRLRFPWGTSLLGVLQKP